MTQVSHKITQARLNYLSDLYACHALFFSYLDKSYGTWTWHLFWSLLKGCFTANYVQVSLEYPILYPHVTA